VFDETYGVTWGVLITILTLLSLIVVYFLRYSGKYYMYVPDDSEFNSLSKFIDGQGEFDNSDNDSLTTTGIVWTKNVVIFYSGEYIFAPTHLRNL